jgi:hypothetical protein
MNRKMKDYEGALETIIKVYGISEAKYGYKSEQTAFTFIETAKIHACQEDWEKAIEYQNRSIGSNRIQTYHFRNADRYQL